ncbi:hypothetical protein GGQ97_000119 [Sphingomonas kaistensis]|uniref:Sugar transporter n=1 Tax=Sphingomonas kaistensis TaxID=298708 RepID=A0A7X6BFS1_9SPHN|nr:hypothetical protein [Sphingomonas kaistensis]NJC04326.1 hypothetical protein [Sphingomonas kaistensis]
MTDMTLGAERTATRGYWIGAVLSTLWMALGCTMYLIEVTLDPATLAPDVRAMTEAIPEWMWAAFALSVWVGLAGAIMLLLRRRLAVPLIGFSVLAELVQNSAYLVDPELKAVTPPGSLILPVVITAITICVFLFALNASKRGILR